MLGENPITIVDQILVATVVIADHLSQLQRPGRARMRGYVQMGQSACPVFDDNEHVHIRNVAVTATKKSQARIALAWFFRKVDQR